MQLWFHFKKLSCVYSCTNVCTLSGFDWYFIFFYVWLRFFLQRFVPGARTLTENETKNFMSGSDGNSDGKIGVDGKSS